MKRNLILYLKDILDNLELAAGFTAGMSYDDKAARKQLKVGGGRNLVR
jgi:uncharacterized protein with HEPN domain